MLVVEAAGTSFSFACLLRLAGAFGASAAASVAAAEAETAMVVLKCYVNEKWLSRAAARLKRGDVSIVRPYTNEKLRMKLAKSAERLAGWLKSSSVATDCVLPVD